MFRLRKGVWDVAGPYIVSRLRQVLLPVQEVDFDRLIDSLSYATWPGGIRQVYLRSGIRFEFGEIRLAYLRIKQSRASWV
jgi:hypothetical protein